MKKINAKNPKLKLYKNKKKYNLCYINTISNNNEEYSN